MNEPGVQFKISSAGPKGFACLRVGFIYLTNFPAKVVRIRSPNPVPGEKLRLAPFAIRLVFRMSSINNQTPVPIGHGSLLKNPGLVFRHEADTRVTGNQTIVGGHPHGVSLAVEPVIFSSP